MKINETITFGDILMVPQYSEIVSRKSIDLTSNLDSKRCFELPIISSPMDTVTGATMAKAMNNAGGFGLIHRYDSIDDQCDRVRRTNATTAAAIGVTGDYLDRATALIKSGCDILCVDVAHGHHALMRHALKTLRNTVGYDVHIMAATSPPYMVLMIYLIGVLIPFVLVLVVVQYVQREYKLDMGFQPYNQLWTVLDPIDRQR